MHELRVHHPGSACRGLLSDPELIALESLDENVSRFVFADDLLFSLRERGLVEPERGRWRLTSHGRKALVVRAAPCGH